MNTHKKYIIQYGHLKKNNKYIKPKRCSSCNRAVQSIFGFNNKMTYQLFHLQSACLVIDDLWNVMYTCKNRSVNVNVSSHVKERTGERNTRQKWLHGLTHLFSNVKAISENCFKIYWCGYADYRRKKGKVKWKKKEKLSGGVMLHMQYAVIYTLLVDYPKYQNAPEPQLCAECACPHGSALSVRDTLHIKQKLCYQSQHYN